jgi:hypothetical protein
MRRVAGNLLDPEVRLGNAGDLREMGDGDELRSLGEPRQGIGDGVSGLTPDARVDLVEENGRLARRRMGDGAQRERDAGELAARGSLRDRREREARIRADEEPDPVATGRPGLSLGELGPEVAVAHPETLQVARNGLGEGLCRRGPGLRKGGREVLHPRLGHADRPLGLRQRVDTGLHLRELGLGGGGAGEQLLRAGSPKAAPRVGNQLQLSFDRVEPARLGLERGEERVERRDALARPDLGVAQLGGDLDQLRRERCDGLERARSLRQPGRRTSLVPSRRIECLDAGGHSLG